MNDSPEQFESAGDDDLQDAYRVILDACIPDLLSFDDSAASVPRANALAALAKGENRDTDRAETLLASLDSEGVVDCSKESIAVLFDPAEDAPAADLSLTTERWALAADALVGEIERLESEVLEEDGRETEERVETKLEETAEEIRDLTPGDGVSDPDELDDDQYERFCELKEEFTYYKKLQEASSLSVLSISPSLSDRADRLRELPTQSTDALAEFEAVVEATATLRDATEDGDFDAICDRFERLAEVLDGLGE